MSEQGMIELRVYIESGNQAVVDDPKGMAAAALRRIADSIKIGRDSGIIFDINGNNIGNWTFDK